MTNLNTTIPELKIEYVADDTGDGLILLEQDNCGNHNSVAIHPVHLRYMAKKFGLIKTSNPAAQKTIATLTRRLQLLHDRIQFLDDSLRNYHGTHEDMTAEWAYSGGTLELAYEFCLDLGLQIDAAPEEKPEAPII